MAISYPLDLPTAIGIANIELRAKNVVAISSSPFTYQQTSYSYGGEMWEADISLPPMNRDSAEQWVSFLVSLRGQSGTFLLNDPIAKTPRGSVRDSDSISITGTAGDTTVSCTMTNNKTLKAGDYIQLGTGTDSTLHKVLEDYTGNGSARDLEIFPALRKARSSVTPTVETAKGLFRLSTSESAWSINNASFYGISFGAMEVV